MIDYYFFLTGGSRSTECVHPRGSHDLYHLESEGRDVILDLVNVVLSHSLVLSLPLLLGNVSPHQVAHDLLMMMLLVSEVKQYNVFLPGTFCLSR